MLFCPRIYCEIASSKNIVGGFAFRVVAHAVSELHLSTIYVVSIYHQYSKIQFWAKLPASGMVDLRLHMPESVVNFVLHGKASGRYKDHGQF